MVEVGCGNGALSVAVARAGADVVGVDLDRNAVEAAARRAEEAGLGERFHPRPGRIDKTWRRLAAAFGRFHAALVNPMRRPLGPRAMGALARLGVERVVYVGPSPVPTARDLGALRAVDLPVQRVIPVDLYPGTYHVLTIALGVRQPPVTP